MTGLEFLEKINDIDPEFIEQSENYKSRHKLSVYRWASVAAAIFVFVTLTFCYYMFSKDKNINTETEFAFKGVKYELASANQLVDCCVVTDLSRFSVEENVYSATKAECGEKLGDVIIVMDGEKINCNIYKYAKADKDDFCVVEYPNGIYRIYVVKEN